MTRVILAFMLTGVMLLSIGSVLMGQGQEEDGWTEGTVEEIQKPRGFQAFGTTPSAVMTGRLTYGYFSTIGQAQAAFVDLRL